MKIIQKALKLSFDRFKPNPYQRRYHFAVAFDGSRPIAISQNNPVKVNAKAKRMGEQFNVRTYIDYPYSHAESHLVCQLLDRYNRIENYWTMVVLRINRPGKVLLSKPCDNCQKIIDSVGFSKVFWSIDRNTFSDSKLIYNIEE